MTRLLFSLFCLLLLAACRPDGVDGPVAMPLTEIVTFEGNIGSGGEAVFSLFPDADSEPVTLVASAPLASDFDAPSRMLIRYAPLSGASGSPRSISLLGGSHINQGPVKTEWHSEYDAWDRDPVFLYSVWRTGPWLNFRLGLPYDDDPRLFTLALVPATAADPYPTLCLVHVLPDDAPDTFRRTIYASYDISEVWRQPTAKGVKVRVNNSNLPIHEFIFEK